VKLGGAQRRERQDGETRLASLLRSSVGLDASTLAGRIESAVLGFQENDPRDDVAVLVLRVSD
jgi:hypothetical protein